MIPKFCLLHLNNFPSVVAFLLTMIFLLSACTNNGQVTATEVLPTEILTATHTPTATIDVSATSIAAMENFRATLESLAATATETTFRATLESMAAVETAIVSSTSAAKTQDAIIEAMNATATEEAFLDAEQSKKDIITAAENICGRKGFPEAANYIAKLDFHPLVLFPEYYNYPQEVRPDSLNELEIVVCIDVSEETIRRQEYIVYKNNQSERGYYCLDTVRSAMFTIRAAQTGNKIVPEFKIRGPEAYLTGCGNSETFSFFDQKTIIKSPLPDFEIIWEKIEDLVLLDMNSKATPLPSPPSEVQSLIITFIPNPVSPALDNDGNWIWSLTFNVQNPNDSAMEIIAFGNFNECLSDMGSCSYSSGEFANWFTSCGPGSNIIPAQGLTCDKNWWIRLDYVPEKEIMGKYAVYFKDKSGSIHQAISEQLTQKKP